MYPIPLNAMRAAAAGVAADTAGTAVAVPVGDIAGGYTDIAADARAALAGAAADIAAVAADARAALADAAGDVAAAADSVDDLYRRACRVRRHDGFHVVDAGAGASGAAAGAGDGAATGTDFGMGA